MVFVVGVGVESASFRNDTSKQVLLFRVLQWEKKQVCMRSLDFLAGRSVCIPGEPPENVHDICDRRAGTLRQ